MVESFGMWEEAVRARELCGIARCELGDFGGTEDMRQALQERMSGSSWNFDGDPQ
jgi:hypothetical protein